MSPFRALALAALALAAALPLAGQVPTPLKGPTPPRLPPLPPPAPSLAIVTSGPIYPYQRVLLTMKIVNYPFTDLDENRLPLYMGDFKRMPSITYGGPQPQRGKDGSVTFSAIGYFPSTASTVRIRTAGLATRKAEDAFLDLSAHATLANRKTYSVTSTWSLKGRFGPKLLHFGVGSFCDGQPPVGSALGVVEHDGKLSFFGRSGPVGTSCVFALKEWLESDGIIGVKWKVERSGPGEQCKQDAGALTRGTAVVGSDGTAANGFAFLSDDANVTFDGVAYKSGNDRPVSALKPTLVGYSCPITLGSDVRTIRFVLDEVTFLAPPGRTFP